MHRLVIDPLFPPPALSTLKKNMTNDLLPENKFQLIFDSDMDGPELIELMKKHENVISEVYFCLII